MKEWWRIGGVLLCLVPGLAWADATVTGIAPPAVYPPDTWQGRTQVVVRVLDRLDSRITLLTLGMGETGHYRSLSVSPTACLERPPTVPPDTAAHLDLEDSLAMDHTVFDGWFLAREPALGGYVSPLYAISVVECRGDKVAPFPGPLPKTDVPHIASVVVPHVTADQPSVEASPSEGQTVAPSPSRLPGASRQGVMLLLPSSEGTRPAPLPQPQPNGP